jgi:integrase
MLLPRLSKVRQVKHHAALPYEKIADFILSLRQQPGTSARALEFAILTGGRTSEVLHAKWTEIDLAGRIRTIPAVRMKGGREHRVPLSDEVVTILENIKKIQRGDYIFPSARKNHPLSNMAMLVLLRRMGYQGSITVHGFRSTFRDWVSERTNFSPEVAESALAHTISNKVEAAYRRGDLFEKHRRLMEAWANYCLTNNSNGTVIRIRG